MSSAIVLLLKTISSFKDETELLIALSNSTLVPLVVTTPKFVELSTKSFISTLFVFIPFGIKYNKLTVFCPGRRLII